MSTQPPSAFDMYIVERIIKALEVVTSMNADVERLKETIAKHDKALGAEDDSLPMKMQVLQGQFASLLSEFKMMHSVMQEKHAQATAVVIADTTGRWGLRAAVITSGGALIIAVVTALIAWLK